MNNKEVLEKIYDLCVLSDNKDDVQKIKELIEDNCDLKFKKLDVFYPVLDHTESVAYIGVKRCYFNHQKNIKIPEAFSKKNLGLMLIVENLDETKMLVVKSGDAYPNSMLGDVLIPLEHGINAIQVADLRRFERCDGSLHLEFPPCIRGSVCAVGDWRNAKKYLDEKDYDLWLYQLKNQAI